MPLMKVAIDTNLIIAGRWNPKSASSKIIELAIQGKIIPVFSEKTKYDKESPSTSLALKRVKKVSPSQTK